MNPFMRALRPGLAVAALMISSSGAKALADTTSTRVTVQVISEDGQPLAGAEVMALTSTGGGDDMMMAGKWKPVSDDGHVDFYEDDVIGKMDSRKGAVSEYHLVARAKGFAPNLAKAAIRAAVAPVTSHDEINFKMKRGRQVAIELVPPAGMTLPPDLKPLLVPKQYVSTTWSTLVSPDKHDPVNVAVAEREPGGKFVFNIGDGTPPLYLMINHPGFLRAWQSDEPVATTATLAQPMRFELPEPVKVTASFVNPYEAIMPTDAHPTLNVTIRQMIPGKSPWLLQAAKIANEPGGRTWQVNDLPPGQYYFMAQEGLVESTRTGSMEMGSGQAQTINLPAQSVIPAIIALDENGTTLTDFEARLAAKSARGANSHSWVRVTTETAEGMARFKRQDLTNSYANAGTQDVFEVEVRAPGYAVSKADVQAGDPSAPPVMVKLNPGKKLTLHLKSEDGRAIPADLKPLVISPEQYPMAMNYLSRPEAAPSLAVAKKTGPDTFEFHVPADTKAFRIALSDKEFIRNFVSDPYTDVSEKPLEITLPRTGSIQATVTLTSPSLLGDQAEDKDKTYLSLTRVYQNMQVTLEGALTGITTTTVISNLPAGDYAISARPYRAYSNDKMSVKVEAGMTTAILLTAEPPSGEMDEFGRPLVKFPAVKVTSADDKMVSGAQVIVRKKSSRSLPTLKWQTVSADGTVKPALGTTFESADGNYEVVARAPGFATATTEVTLPTSATLVPVKLQAGKQVAMQINDESDRPIPADLIPGVFPESWGVAVWLTAQDDKADTYKPENVLSPVAVARDANGSAGRYTLNVDAGSTEPLFVLVNHPGFMRAFQAGPFAPADWATSGVVEITLPKPASLSARFDLNNQKSESSVVTMKLDHTRKVPGANRWGLHLVTEEMPATSASLSVTDLAPGEYSMEVVTAPKNENFGNNAFTTKESATLDAGESQTLTLKYSPFQKEWLEGPYSANVKVLNQKGEPAAGAEYKVTWYARGYPQQTVAEGTVPEDGLVKLKNLAGVDKPMTRAELKERGDLPSFTFTVGNQRLDTIDLFEYKDGKFVPLADGAKSKDFEFRVPPAEGDVAPDFAMHDLVTSKTVHLSDFKGQVVLIDFWATWCGPCQGPMAENQEIMRKHAADWKDKAVILAVSIDDDMDTVLKHLDKNDWHETRNVWAAPDPGDPEKAGWKAPAASLYGINSIPTMVLIDTNGVIQKRGHISEIESEMKALIKDKGAAPAERKGGGDLVKIPLSETSYSPAAGQQDAVRPPGAETGYRGTPGAKGPIKVPGSETSYSPRAGAGLRRDGGDGDAVRVALFADPVSTDKKSREAMWNVLSQAEGIRVEKVTTETVRRPDFFDDYDVFILPGGTGGGEARAVGVDAGKAIARQVKQGKGLIAVCAGGYYVAEGWNPATSALDVINAQNHDGEHWARGEQFIAVKVVGAKDGQSSRTMWFENGPIFKPASVEGLTDYVPLVRYATDLAAKGAPKGQMKGRDAVIAAPYGKGRVVAFGPHPELSPDLNHWLVNAIKWSAGKTGKNQKSINAETVLEGK